MIAQKKKVMMQSAASSPLTVKTGTVTLSSSNYSKIVVTPIPGRVPFLAVLKKEPLGSGANQTNGAIYVNLPVDGTISGSYYKSEFIGTALRVSGSSSYSTIVAPDTAETWVDAATGAITFVGQSGYIFLAGTYKWYAVYGDIYEEAGV